jgi:histone-lysine N-methyltransferase SETMAR
MAALVKTWSNIEVRSVIRFLRVKGTPPSEIHRQLVEVYGPNVISRKQVWLWCKHFDNGRTEVMDEQRPGRPRTSVTDDNVIRIEGMIHEDRRIQLRIIAEDLKMSLGAVHQIVHNQLGYSKVSSHWVPKMLTDNHKATRMGLSLFHLMRYQEQGDQFLQRLVTGDETWVYHFTPESKRASMTWKHTSSPPPKKFKATLSTNKILATVFWDHDGVLLVDFLSKGETVNATRYCETLVRLRDAIRHKRPGLLRQGVVLLHDNARPHTASSTRKLLQRFKWEVLEHPPYSPDLAPSDYHLFGPLKKHLAGKRYATVDQVHQAVMSWLRDLDSDFFRAGIFALVYRWNKCLDKYGDYVEK